MTRMEKILLPDLSYKLTGILFRVHNELGRFCKEKQYADVFEERLKIARIKYEREKKLFIDESGISGNQVDFCIENKILVDIKAKRFLTREDYYQMLRYLKAGNLKLGMIVNFRNRYLKPKRIINSEI